MDMENIFGLMDQHIKAHGKKTKSMAKEYLPGTTVVSMKVNGRVIRWMVLGSINGQMAENMKENI